MQQQFRRDQSRQNMRDIRKTLFRPANPAPFSRDAGPDSNGLSGSTISSPPVSHGHGQPRRFEETWQSVYRRQHDNTRSGVTRPYPARPEQWPPSNGPSSSFSSSPSSSLSNGWPPPRQTESTPSSIRSRGASIEGRHSWNAIRNGSETQTARAAPRAGPVARPPWRDPVSESNNWKSQTPSDSPFKSQYGSGRAQRAPFESGRPWNAGRYEREPRPSDRPPRTSPIESTWGQRGPPSSASTPLQKAEESERPRERRRGSGRLVFETTDDDATTSPQSQKQSQKHSSQKDDTNYDDEDAPGQRRKLAEARRKRREEAALRKRTTAPPPVHLPEFISVANLASLLKVKLQDFTAKLKDLGFEHRNHDHVFTAETAGLIAAEYRYEPIYNEAQLHDLCPLPELEDKSGLPLRPPVVTIMGHVDHGKTTLLDHLRKSSVAASEHGGITQHIGAFSVRLASGMPITFLDTPGHEAFLTMRQRGANVTDIVVLVVAADDSVKPQTVEAIKHARSARVPMVVAINKVDKLDADVEKVKQDLARSGIELEDFGGDTQAICVSGKTGQGMGELEDATITLSEVLDIRADPEGRCEGWVVEASTKRAGRMATVLVRRGTLRSGDVLVAARTWTRVRTLKNEAGVEVDAAGPGTPVEVDGWRELPEAGAEVLQCEDEALAKRVVMHREARGDIEKMTSDVETVNKLRREQQLEYDQARANAQARKLERYKAHLHAVRSGLKFSDVWKEPQAAAKDSTAATEPKTTTAEVTLVIKADTGGSVEAVVNCVSPLGNEFVRPKMVRTGVGGVTESDVDMAFAANGCVVAFNTPKLEPGVARMAETKQVPIVEHNIIYHLTEAVKAKMSEKLPELVTQRVTGEAEIAAIFHINVKRKVSRPIAGCKVRNGIMNRNSKVRVMRDQQVIFDGEFSHVCFYLSLHGRPFLPLFQNNIPHNPSTPNL